MELLADLVFWLHFVWVLLIILGIVLSLIGWIHHRPGLQISLIGLIFLTMVSDIIFRECALTTLENYLRSLAGQQVTTSFFAKAATLFNLSLDLNKVSLIFLYSLILGMFSIAIWNLKAFYDFRSVENKTPSS
ncbi:DUF2784 family protein [Candidatus Berkelbacteria bacterium]|nr:DUF2784 family protein [Candidatus Berkelbacteria bacterium]